MFFFLFIDASNLGRKIKMLYQTGVKKNKRVAYPCLTWKTTFLRKNLFKKSLQLYYYQLVTDLSINRRFNLQA